MSTSNHYLQRENAEMKRQLKILEEQLLSVQHQITMRNAQDHRLKNHILIARKEVSDEVQPISWLTERTLGATRLNGLYVFGSA